MTIPDIQNMLSEVIQFADYDLWKELFLDPDQTLGELNHIAAKHIRDAGVVIE